MTRSRTPAVDEVEVSVFGPGIGESIVIHIGDGRWIVVDSCTVGGACVPLIYLEELGVDLSTDVVLVVASHAHDDHIKGLGELYRRCRSARLALPSAATAEEFTAMLRADKDMPDLRARVLQEYCEVFDDMDTRPKRGRFLQGISGRTEPLSSTGSVVECSVTMLTPSDEDVLESRRVLASLLPQAGDPIRRLLVKDPNHFAMAMVIRCGTRGILLGSDVLTGSLASETGWCAAVGRHASLLDTIEVCKVAHHGSDTGHHEDLWRMLAANNVVSILTPFLSSNLPTEADLDRIDHDSAATYVTSGSPKLNEAQRRLLRRLGVSGRLKSGDSGHVRARASAVDSSQWVIDVFGHARKL